MPTTDDEPAPDARETLVATDLESEPMVWCPVCDNRLSNKRCKLTCERCGYFMSCADYY
jgi:hypothetical protein